MSKKLPSPVIGKFVFSNGILHKIVKTETEGYSYKADVYKYIGGRGQSFKPAGRQMTIYANRLTVVEAKETDKGVRVENKILVNAIDHIRRLLRKETVLHTVVNNYGRNGCSGVKVLAIDKNRIIDVSPTVSDILGWKWLDNGAVQTSSAFNVVSAVASAVYGDDYTIKHFPL